jgi:hypothetical protein
MIMSRDQSQFLGGANRVRFRAEVETKGELVLYSSIYGFIRHRRTAADEYVVEWAGDPD